VGAPTGTPEATESRLLEMLSVRNTREAAAETAAPEPPLGETQASVPTATFAPSLAPSSTLLSTLVGAVSPTPTPTPGYGAATGQAAATAEPARSVITVVSGEVGQAMRNAPNGQFVRELPADAILDVRNASSDNQWVDVALEDGRSGWVPISAVSLLRDAPARSGAVVARVSPGTRLEVLGTSPDAAWLNVRLFNGQEGWMSAPLVSFSTPTAVPTATPTPDPNATVIVNRRPTVNWPPGTGLRIAIGGQSVWVRAQPSSRNDQIVTTLANNNPVTATGNFRWDGRQFWWEIRTQFGAVGWIEQSYLVPQ
jgi:SH3-like domain-containing protein